MLIVFDLDFTLWDCEGTWCDHTNPPYYRENGAIRDEDGRLITLYPEVISILDELESKDIVLAVASRTNAPDWANDLMELFGIKKYFHHFEIYPGSKVEHFQSLQKKIGISFDEMFFFDDEYRNIDEVGRLGVNAVYVENGINKRIVENIIT